MWFADTVIQAPKDGAVAGLTWAGDGQALCIVQNCQQSGDSFVSVYLQPEGSKNEGKPLKRKWRKRFKKATVCRAAWSPDGAQLVCGQSDGEVIILNSKGKRPRKLQLAKRSCGDLGAPKGGAAHDGKQPAAVSSIGWSHHRSHLKASSAAAGAATDNAPQPASPARTSNTGPASSDGADAAATAATHNPEPKSLAILRSDGLLQLMQGADDPHPATVETSTHDSKCFWNPDGTVLAVGGKVGGGGADGGDGVGGRGGGGDGTDGTNIIKYYSAVGEHLHTMAYDAVQNLEDGAPLPISAVAWGEGGLRMAASIGSTIYFAHVRPQNYHYAKFDATLVYGIAEGTSYVQRCRCLCPLFRLHVQAGKGEENEETSSVVHSTVL